MTVKIRLTDGPGAGKVLAIQDVRDTVKFPVPEPVDITSMDDLTTTWLPNFRTVLYRARRIASTGHPVHNAAQEVLFDCVGER